MQEKDGWKRVRASIPDYRIIIRAEEKAKNHHNLHKIYVRGAHYEYLFEKVAGMNSIVYRKKLKQHKTINNNKYIKFLVLGLILIVGIYICIDTLQLEPVNKQIEFLFESKISYPISVYSEEENTVMTLCKNNTIKIDDVKIDGKWDLIEKTELFYKFLIQSKEEEEEGYLLLFFDGKARLERQNKILNGYWKNMNSSPIESIKKYIKLLKNKKGDNELLIGETATIDSFAITLKDVRILDEYFWVGGIKYIYFGSGSGGYISYNPKKNNKINGYSVTIHTGDKEEIIFCSEIREIKEWSAAELECRGQMLKEIPTNGAKFLFMYIKIENIGNQKSQLPYFDPLCNVQLFCQQNEIVLVYDETTISPPYHIINTKKSIYYPIYYSRHEKVYPGISKEGWIAFEVPKEIELSKTTLKIRNVIWKLDKEN